jgi:adenylate kinase
MQIVMIGPPGAGKGTQANMLATKYGVPHISTGDMLRDQVERKSPIGLVIKNAVDKGELVADNILLDLIRIKIACVECSTGFIFDGFPRTIFQAQWLNSHGGRNVTAIEISVDHEEILRRTAGRQRVDDKPDTVEERLRVYHAQIAPVIDYYKGQSQLCRVDGNKSVDEVFQSIVGVIGEP